MSKAKEIMIKMKELLLGLPTEQKRVSDDKITKMVEDHELILLHMDGLFSILRTKRFHVTMHVTMEDIRKASEHQNWVVALWRRLGKSFTPKVHVIEAHAVEMLERHCGYGDLGEDAGERAHQLDSTVHQQGFCWKEQ